MQQFTAFPTEMGGKVAVSKSGCGLNIKKCKHYAYEAENGIQLDGRTSDPPPPIDSVLSEWKIIRV